MRALHSVQSHSSAWRGPQTTEAPVRMHLYRDQVAGGYVATASPLLARSAGLQPQFDGQAVPAVICRAFIVQYGGEIR